MEPIPRRASARSLAAAIHLAAQCRGRRLGASTDPTDVLEACIFPDMSSIDSWGLAYHSMGIIRGKDLSKVLRYADPYSAAKSDGKSSSSPF